MRASLVKCVVPRIPKRDDFALNAHPEAKPFIRGTIPAHVGVMDVREAFPQTADHGTIRWVKA